MLLDTKTPLLWLLGLGLFLAIAGLGREHMAHLKTRAELSDLKATHARAEASRATVALNDAVGVTAGQAVHAASQQEIVHEFTKPDPQLAAALADNRALSGRLRDASAKLAAAARDRPEGEGDAAACRDQGDQLRALLGLSEEAGRLLAEGVELGGESRSLVVRRDGEVRALKALVAADRALMEPDGAGLIAGP